MAFSTLRPFVTLFGLLIVVPMSMPMVEANTFLGRHDDERSAPDPKFQDHLLLEIGEILGNEHHTFTEKRLQRIEKDLKPMFTAMPKTPQGKLQPAAINYMLHRAFVQRHGWFVRSLSGEGKSMSMWNSSSAATTVLENKVPDQVISAFEKRAGAGGTGIQEVAFLAATLEHLAHQEAIDRLRTAYQTFNFQYDDVVSAEEADSVIQAYMAIYILGGYLSAMSNNTALEPAKIRLLLERIESVYPTWQLTLAFALDVKQRFSPNRDYLYFADLANVIEEFGERFGEFQDQECLQMKDKLVEAERPGSPGRVHVADFYALAKQSSEGLFSESIGYLRELGALDESDPVNPRVLVANYINGPSNCIASSEYYSVCCRDECENLLSNLENQLQRSDATPAQLKAMVAALPSRTEAADRTLSPWLLARLDEMVAHHGGRVPLHGRLFAQWMHYAYPRECAYPHVAGAIAPQRIEDVLSGPDIKESIANIVASAEEMDLHIEEAQSMNFTLDTDASMWVLDEELLVTHEAMPSLRPVWVESLGLNSVRGVAFVAAAFTVTMGLVRSSGKGNKLYSGYFSPNEKYMV